MNTDSRHPASFRDPSGFIFEHQGVLYRQVNQAYSLEYTTLMDSGLYKKLTGSGLLLPHEQVGLELAQTAEAFQVIQPQPAPFISYPYEWSFSQLQAAALTTLKIQKLALQSGMSLKDSSAYNIQFVHGKAILIDTLSFERYRENTPWTPYCQFCQHFLAPLALMAYRDVRLGQLLRVFIDGIPLELTATLLPRRSCFRMPLLLHLHLHAASQRRFEGKAVSQAAVKQGLSRTAMLGLLDSLENGVKGLRWNAQKTAWAGYYQDDSYTAAGLEHKQQIVAGFIDRAAPQTCWDLGANTGLFSRIASRRGIPTVAWDIDPGAVDINYRQMVQDQETNLLPLLLDLTNPSPAIGWQNRERMALAERGPADMILALIHHLVIANNTPMDMVAAFLAQLCRWLVIEFVPKEDPKVQRLLASREDIFPAYTQAGFEVAFKNYFMIERTESVQESLRVLYLMRKL